MGADDAGGGAYPVAAQVPQGAQVVVAPARMFFEPMDQVLESYLAWLLQHEWVDAAGVESILIWAREPLEPLGVMLIRCASGTQSAVTVAVDKQCRRCGAVMSLHGPPVLGPEGLISCDDAVAYRVLES